MADKKNNIDETEVKDTTVVPEEETQAEQAETPKADDKNAGGFVKVCKKAGRIAEAFLAIFGGIVSGLMIVDGVRTAKRRKSISAPTQQIPETAHQVLDDVKVNIEI